MPRQIRFQVHTEEYLPFDNYQFESTSDALFAIMNMMSVLDPIFPPEFDPLQIAIQNSENDLQLYRKDNVDLIVGTQPYDTTDKKYDECSICTDKYQKNEDVSVLDCGHIYHLKCIKEWGKYKPVCPVCKTEISNRLTNTGINDID